MSKALKLVIK